MNSYIDEQGISLYLKDALNQFCQLRRSKPSLKSSPLSPGAYDQSNIAQFLSEYCRSVQYGTHLYKREYEYIMLTTRNRLRLENCKLGCVVRMVVYSILLHAESGRNDHRKDAPLFIPSLIISHGKATYHKFSFSFFSLFNNLFPFTCFIVQLIFKIFDSFLKC